ncbi:MAG: inorganic pyrophosphatase, partial [Proteobacteria bacterium]
LVQAKPIGGLRLIDRNQADDKIIAALAEDGSYGEWRDIDDCPKLILERLQHYFLTYKQMPKEAARRVEIAGIYGRVEAQRVIKLSLQDYIDSYRH